MNYIVMSYASTDRERDSVLACSVEARGLQVWWDRVIPPGRADDDETEEALVSAACVTVSWSHASAGRSRCASRRPRP